MHIVVRTKEDVEHVSSYVKDFHRSDFFVYIRTFDAILELPKFPDRMEVVRLEKERQRANLRAYYEQETKEHSNVEPREVRRNLMSAFLQAAN